MNSDEPPGNAKVGCAFHRALKNTPTHHTKLLVMTTPKTDDQRNALLKTVCWTASNMEQGGNEDIMNYSLLIRKSEHMVQIHLALISNKDYTLAPHRNAPIIHSPRFRNALVLR